MKPDALQAGVSASDAARTFGVVPSMVKEHLLSAERKGLLCRDISSDGFCFYINLTSKIVEQAKRRAEVARKDPSFKPQGGQ
ncbi:vacuolar protein sorting-associated protein 36-like [Arachis stenosperma]|uniref:vacuolar protein sorting-associated protein 36-like n=1 Tax=Arachis stenosperma TaxID=217475 RepID=UPI0025AB76DA|nr:vacuolar protein sorting-associated protein 36-like [Arachis stenosperma]